MISNGKNNGETGPERDEYPISRRKGKAVMERQAVRLGWSLPDDYKDAIVKRQVQIAIDPQASNREATSAARCLTSMNGQNVAIAISNVDEETNRIDRPTPEALLAAMQNRTSPPE